MTGSQDQRMAVFPTRMALNTMKIKLKGAQKGHSLLKRKSDALTARFRIILQKIRDAKLAMGAAMKQAYFALAEVNFTAGDISMAVREKVGHATLRVRARKENVSGVQLPVLEPVSGLDGLHAGMLSMSGAGSSSTRPTSPLLQESSSSSMQQQQQQLWLGRGGQQVQKCRDAYVRALEALVELAGLQTSFFILNDVIRATNRRVNALEHVLVPRLDNTVSYITSELDEQDREDFFRLKKVQGNKKNAAADEEEELSSHYHDSDAGDADKDRIPVTNLLTNADDADIFV